MTVARYKGAFISLFTRLGLATIAFVLPALILGVTAVNDAQAAIEQIYTLPFLDNDIITCPYGPYSQCPGGGAGFHYGTDYQIGVISAPGEQVVAATSGTVKLCQGGGGGNYIVMDHGNGHRTRYLHLQAYAVANGQYVARGAIVGYEGNSEVPDGSNHLHFETRHAATTFTCGSNGTAVDPYAPSTYMWTTNPPSYPNFAIATFYDYGSGIARIHAWTSTGTSFTGYSPDGWWSGSGYTLSQVGDRAVAGDFSGDGKDDVATFYDYGGGVARIHAWTSTGTSFTGYSPNGWWSGSGYLLDQVGGRVVAGDFNGQ